MDRLFNISFGIQVGGLMSVFGLLTLEECKYSTIKRGLTDHQTITGTIVKESYNRTLLFES